MDQPPNPVVPYKWPARPSDTVSLFFPYFLPFQTAFQQNDELSLKFPTYPASDALSD